jgi:hypothetical protein
VAPVEGLVAGRVVSGFRERPGGGRALCELLGDVKTLEALEALEESRCGTYMELLDEGVAFEGGGWAGSTPVGTLGGVGV